MPLQWGDGIIFVVFAFRVAPLAAEAVGAVLVRSPRRRPPRRRVRPGQQRRAEATDDATPAPRPPLAPQSVVSRRHEALELAHHVGEARHLVRRRRPVVPHPEAPADDVVVPHPVGHGPLPPSPRERPREEQRRPSPPADRRGPQRRRRDEVEMGRQWRW